MNLATFRPRFSLKWLLIVVTALSVALFVLLIYPTTKAKRFVAGVNNGSIDNDAATGNPKPIEFSKEDVGEDGRSSAELLPWDWSDLFRLRRRVEIIETCSAGVRTWQRPAVISLPVEYERITEITGSLAGYNQSQSTVDLVSTLTMGTRLPGAKPRPLMRWRSQSHPSE